MRFHEVCTSWLPGRGISQRARYILWGNISLTVSACRSKSISYIKAVHHLKHSLYFFHIFSISFYSLIFMAFCLLLEYFHIFPLFFFFFFLRSFLLLFYALSPPFSFFTFSSFFSILPHTTFPSLLRSQDPFHFSFSSLSVLFTLPLTFTSYLLFYLLFLSIFFLRHFLHVSIYFKDSSI